jgi:hypothetical protein
MTLSPTKKLKHNPNTQSKTQQRAKRRASPAKGGTAASFIEFCTFVALNKI